MQTSSSKRPAPSDLFQDWNERDKMRAATLIVFGILLVWSLIMLYAQNNAIAGLQTTLQQERKQISDLQNQVTDNDNKRQADTTSIMNMLANRGGTSANPNSGANGAPPNANNNDGNGTNFNDMQPSTTPNEGSDNGTNAQ